jgi:hypothetical protein
VSVRPENISPSKLDTNSLLYTTTLPPNPPNSSARSGWSRLSKLPAESDMEVDRSHRAGEHSGDARFDCHDTDVVLQALSLPPEATLRWTGWTVEVSICEVDRARY